VGLEEVGDAAPVLAEGRHRVGAQTACVPFHDDGLVACPRDRQGGSQPRNPSTGDHESHEATIRRFLTG
jgi:hypothetical protein